MSTINDSQALHQEWNAQKPASFVQETFFGKPRLNFHVAREVFGDDMAKGVKHLIRMIIARSGSNVSIHGLPETYDGGIRVSASAP